jgi:uncharacterized protein
MTAVPMRLLPGDDLKLALDRLVVDKGWRAVTVLSGIGSLTRAMIRYADKPEPSRVDGPLEILSLSGTLASFGGSHLHVAVADATGRVLGGHVKEGCVVRTTAEIVLGVLDGYTFHREHDPKTHHPELVIGLQ